MANKNYIGEVRNIDNVINRINEEREARGWSQKKLASEAGKGEDWLSRRLTKNAKVNVEDLLVIANALGVDPGSLLRDAANGQEKRSLRDYFKDIMKEVLEEERVNRI